MSRYILQSHETGTAKNGNPWLRLGLMDKKGAIKAMVWNYTSLPQDIQDAVFNNGIGKVFDVSGDVEQFNNENQIKVNTLRLSPDQTIIDLLPSVDHDYQQLKEFCKYLIESIPDEKVKEITKLILYADDIWSDYITKVAGKVNHHAVVGGLLAHSVGVATSALQLSNFYTDLNRSLIIAGGLIHDVGKCRVYTNFEEGLDYNDDGKFFDHIVLGINILHEKTRDLGPEYLDTIKQLEHIIVSHHEKLEWGSPVEPRTIEARIIARCDNIDAFMDVAHTTFKNATELGFTSPSNRMAGRELFVSNPNVNKPYYRIPNIGNNNSQG